MSIAGAMRKAAKRVNKAASKQTAGQKKVEKATKGQRAYARGQIKGAAAGATGAAALAGLGITELRARLKEAETDKERAQLKAAIEMAVAEANKEEPAKPKRTVPRNSQSPKPKLRPKMAKGGKVKKYNKGGYAKCGASYTG